MRDQSWTNGKLLTYPVPLVLYLDSELEFCIVICIVIANTIIVAQRRVWNHAKYQ